MPATTATATTAPLSAWGVDGRLTVPDAGALAASMQIARLHLKATARAADRADPRAEVHQIPCAAGQPVTIGPLLTRIITAALQTAHHTGGLVDPTVPTPRRPPARASRPPLLTAVPVCGSVGQSRSRVTWRDVQLDGTRVRVPGGCTLDLRATALAVALDDISLIASRLTGADVVIELGGRAARVGRGQATVRPDRVVDPRTGQPAPGCWRQIEVSAGTCRIAGAHAVAAAVLGQDAPGWLAEHGATARLTTPSGEVVTIGQFVPVTAPIAVAA